jgi:hypothetical protein
MTGGGHHHQTHKLGDAEHHANRKEKQGSSPAHPQEKLVQVYWHPQKHTSSQDRPEFSVIAKDKQSVEGYRAGTVSLLLDVLDTNEVFTSDHGHLNRAPKAMMKQYFETANPDEVTDIILKQGQLRPYQLKIKQIHPTK